MDEITGLTALLHLWPVEESKEAQTYGETDDQGRSPVEGKPIKPEDLNASIAYLLGLPLNDVQYSPSGRPFTIAHKGEPLFDVIA